MLHTTHEVHEPREGVPIANEQCDGHSDARAAAAARAAAVASVSTAPPR